MTPEQLVAPTVIRQSLEALREDHLVNNPIARQKIEDALGALRHLEQAFVQAVLQTGKDVPRESAGVPHETISKTVTTGAAPVVKVDAVVFGETNGKAKRKSAGSDPEAA